MRHNAKRSNRGKSQKKGNARTRVYDSNGPDVKVRGTAYQITEKYDILAKDAETSGNYVLAENYRQHAEHYQRIISSFDNETPASTDTKPEEAEVEVVEQVKAPVTETQEEMAVA